MGEVVTIYHTDIEIPEVPNPSEVEDWGTDNPEEQYWRRKPLPSIFKNLDYDTDGNIVLSLDQKKYCLKELDKIRNGCWVMINGVATYLPYNYYYYLQYWTLENKKHPEYRDVSRRYAVYRWHWRNNYWCLGILRGKGRRTGATSEITSNVTCEVTTNKNRRGGVISKTGKDARKIFLYRVQFGFRHLPFFLQPTLENDKDSKTELVFNVPIKKTKNNKQVSLIDEVEGINSMIDYQAPGLNTYDQERLTDLLLDEGGKMESDIPFSEFLSIISECLVEGGEKVGFAEMPSTVNKWSKGGEQFKIAWDGATWVKNKDREDEDEDINDDNEATANRFVRYYCPAYDGLPGFIGKFGESIIEAPNEHQTKYLISKYGEAKFNGVYKYGAKEYLLRKRRNLSGASLEEEIRKYSFDETEMFMSASEGCVFNIVNINNREGYLKDNPIYKREVLFYMDDEHQVVKWRDISKKEREFCWRFSTDAELTSITSNQSVWDGRIKKPGRTKLGAISVDSYSNSQGGRKYGSKASAWVGRKYDVFNSEKTGKPVGHLYGRPTEKDALHRQVMLASIYFGYEVFYEHTADDYYTYFRDRGKIGYLGRYPLSLIDVVKRNNDNLERHRGTPITPFSLTKQLDNGVAYFENHCDKLDFEEIFPCAKQFDPYNRTESDIIVSLLILITVLIEPVNTPQSPKFPLVKVYDGIPRQQYN